MNPTRIRLFALILLSLHAGLASAYVDPGAGMLLIQGLITVIVVLLAFIRNPWKTVKGWIERIRHRNDA